MDEIEFYLADLASRFPKDRENYYLSYSGGRDSHFLYWFIKNYLHDDKITIVSVNTFMEHPQIRERMYKYADIVLLPEMKPFEIKEKYGSPCFSKMNDEMIMRYQKGSRTENTMNYIMGKNPIFKLNKKAQELLLSGSLHKISNKCCENLKKKPLKKYAKESGKKAILGVCGFESKLRKSQYHSCFKKDGTFTPLWDMTEDRLNQIYERYDIETPSIYSEIDRTGCMGCPYAPKKNTEKELRLVTKSQRRFLGEYFKESYAVLGIDIEAIKQECGDYDDVWEDDL